MDRKCPKCGSKKTKLVASSAKQKTHHGFLYKLFVGFAMWIYKGMVGLFILAGDIWMLVIAKIQGKGYSWKAAQWFSPTRNYYHCEECGHDFRG